ncbi:MAG: histone deacetylase family protein [Parvularculaceae bacterium]
MRIFRHPDQSVHAPALEMRNGAWVPYVETPARLAAIDDALNATTDDATIEAPADHGRDPVLAVHDADYVRFLETAHGAWRDAGREGDALPYVFPVRGRRPLAHGRVDGALGQYAFDCGTPIAVHTWRAAYWSAQTAVAGVDAAMADGGRAFAMCRPPGHHAGKDYLGGYCYLNNAAIAAERALARGAGRVAVLDVDYHHGNGSQDLFYERGEVLTVSLHADPATDYPFYWGRADETGAGDGLGANLNLPAPRGTDWPAYKERLGRALDAVGAFAPDVLIVPFGADTHTDDPISFFSLATSDYDAMGAAIARIDAPTLVCMEGGYAVDVLGANVAAFLRGLDRRV